MKRFLYLAFCILTAALITLSFAACGEVEPGGSSTSTDTSKEEDGSNNADSSGEGADSSDTQESSDEADSSDTSDSSVTEDSSFDPWLPGDDHEHEFENTYSYDDEYHYYAASCEHTNEKKDMEKHSYDWETGTCKCGYSIDVIKALIETVISNSAQVKNTETATVKLRESFKEEINESFAIYDDYIFSKTVDSDYTTLRYYTVGKNGGIFAVLVQDERVSLIADALDEDLLGTKYTFTYMYDFDNYVIGAEALIKHFYTMGEANTNGDLVTSVKDGVYSFSYGIFLQYEIDYFNVINVSFRVDEKTGILKTANIDVKRYGEGSYTETDGIYTLNSDARVNDETKIEINQSATVKDEVENPYSPDKVLPKSLLVVDKHSGKSIDGLIMDIESGGQINITFDKIKPESALIGLCQVKITMINNKDKTILEIEPFNYGAGYMFSVSQPGEYTLKVEVNGIVSEGTVNVALKKPVSISAQVYSEQSKEYEIVKILNTYTGIPVYIKSLVNEDCNPEYIASVLGDDKLNKLLTKGKFNGENVTVFTASAAGKYTVQLKSSVNSSTTCTLLINVVEKPSLEDMLKGSFNGENELGDKLQIAFDNINMTVKATLESAYGNEEVELTFSIDGDKLAFEYADGDDFIEEMYFSEQFNLVAVVYGEEIVLAKEEEERNLVSSGTINLEDVIGEGKASYEYKYEYYSNGEIVIFKDFSVFGADISLKLTKEGLLLKYSTYDYIVLTIVEGTKGVIPGKYKAEIDSVIYANVTVTQDKKPTYVKEPTRGTLEIVDKSAGSTTNRLDYVYSYEIIDGEFVIYKDGVVTDEIALELVGDEYMFLFPRILNSMPLAKQKGYIDVLGGEYNVQMAMGNSYFVLAKIFIVPGAGVVIDPVPEEPTYGTLEIVDKKTEQTTVYTYEIINGAFVFYKDNKVTNEIIVIDNGDGTYALQTLNHMVPQLLIKVDGEEGILAGVYNCLNGTETTHTLTFAPGTLEKEADKGTVTVTAEIETNQEYGEYTYVFEDGGFAIYKNGEKTAEITIYYDMDGVTLVFQCIDTPQPQRLEKADGHSSLLAGTYNVINSVTGEVMYSIVFTPDIMA